MGTYQHHAIIATTCAASGFRAFGKRAKEQEWERYVRITGRHLLYNGLKSVCVFPDGSKEGWVNSKTGDDIRDQIVAWFTEQNRTGKGYWTWVEVSFGELGQWVTRGSAGDGEYTDLPEWSEEDKPGDREPEAPGLPSVDLQRLFMEF